jgi:hypothetical protein
VHPKAALPLAMASLGCLAIACVAYRAPRGPRSVLLSQPAPSADESYCAWYGSHRDGVLYFGEAPFWAASRAAGDPAADLARSGPQLVGRVDLRRAALLRPLDVTAPGARSGVWDVLAHPNGRIYFTTFFESAGSVDPQSGNVERFDAAGTGLNELSPGPDGSILASRYGGPQGSDGSVVLLGPDGAIQAEHRLGPVPGNVVAAKSVAFDPTRGEIWVNTDLLPRAGGPVRHDARILDLAGRERLRIEEPELQFFAFRPDGVGLAAEADADGLWLRVLRPDDDAPMPARGERFLADQFFERSADFAQDIQFGSDGRAVVTRWSGRVHVVDPAPPLARTLRLSGAGSGLFYTGVLEGSILCATRCDAVQVVCEAADPF